MDLIQRATAYYRCHIVSSLDFEVGETYPPFIQEYEEAEEDTWVEPVNIIPMDVLAATGFADSYEERLEVYRAGVGAQTSDKLRECSPEFLAYMLQPEIMDIFVPEHWTGVTHPDTGEPWVFELTWQAKQSDTCARGSYGPSPQGS